MLLVPARLFYYYIQYEEVRIDVIAFSGFGAFYHASDFVLEHTVVLALNRAVHGFNLFR